MSSALLIINTVLFLSFGPFRGASDLIRDNVQHEKENENAQDLNGINSHYQTFMPSGGGVVKRSETSIRNYLQENPDANSLCNRDTHAHFNLDHHHQIHKRNLNRDFPVKRMVNNGRQLDPYSFISKPNIFKEISTNDQKDTLRDFVDKIVLNDKMNLDETDSFDNGGLQTLNDTTKISSKDNFILKDINQKFKELKKYAADDNNSNSYSNDDIYFINNPNDDVNTIDVFSIDGLNERNDKGVKREASETITNSSCDTLAIKDEIDKVYKDISDNVRLLSKLRDKESLLLKRPSNKRWIIVDNTINDKQRKKKCIQELTVEMDTNRDATPDRLEHIERKVEEEVLQVNVPLKCNH